MLEKGNRANTLHGILLIALFSFAAFYIAEVPVVRRLSFSPLIVGIVLGMLYANSLRNKLPETWVPGIRFCTKQVLRWGIILYGFRLTLTEVAAVGIPAVAVDLIVVVVTILGGVLLGRLLKMDRDTALMTSTGSAICGAAAVLGAEPVVKCEGYKTAIAVSTVVIFGTLSMFLYPVMYRTGMLDGLTDTGVAVYTGSTLHEVAHVAGAGNAMDPTPCWWSWDSCWRAAGRAPGVKRRRARSPCRGSLSDSSGSSASIRCCNTFSAWRASGRFR